MSSVVKGVKKVFKKVTKVVRKVAPIALAAGAVIFTAGAALGVGPMAGGWGAAASSLTSSLGVQGSLAPIVTGAVTQAGYGAAIGAATSAITGGDISDGALMGAAGGAVTGGVMGAAGMGTDPLANTFRSDAGPVSSSTGITGARIENSGIAGATVQAAPGGTPAVTGTTATGSPITGTTAAPTVTPAGSTAPTTSRGFFSEGGWLERNQGLVGPMIGGVGRGLLTGMAAKEAADSQQEQTQQIINNYGTTGTGLRMAATPQPAGPAGPAVHERYPSAVRSWQYNPATGRIERIPQNVA
jgi:hypothetical protein